MILKRFESVAAAAAALAGGVSAELASGLSERGAASLAVAGGRTPVPFFRSLRAMPLDWKRVAITLTDERWVPEQHEASNGALVRRELLAEAAAAARFVPLFNGASTPAAGAPAAWKSLQDLARPFDAVVLGMGEDGHFASLFPGNPGLKAALDSAAAPTCVAMRAPVEPVERISLNLAALAQSRRMFLFVTGAAKLDLILAAARDAAADWPVSTLLALRRPMPEIYWAP